MIPGSPTPASSWARLGIGGDYAWDWPAVWDGGAAAALFATGRDALAAIVASRDSQHQDWLVPDFTCPVVPDILRRCGVSVRPYAWLTPWSADEADLKKALPGATGIIVPFYMGLPPAATIWDLLDGRSLCVVEDRAQYVGAPPAPQSLRGNYAINSFRKWSPVPDGAYCVARDGKSPLPGPSPNRDMVRLRLAAALTKCTRMSDLPSAVDRSLEETAVELFRLGEMLSDPGGGGHRASALAESIVASSDFAAICAARLRNQAWLATRLAGKASVSLLEPAPGVMAASKMPLLALPVMCSDRNQVRQKLIDRRVFCPVHWKDGNWAGGNGPAAAWAAGELSLLIDQRYESADLQRIVDALD